MRPVRPPRPSGCSRKTRNVNCSAVWTNSTLGVIGLNTQLDHSWIDSDNFLNLASAADIPVIHSDS